MVELVAGAGELVVQALFSRETILKQANQIGVEYCRDEICSVRGLCNRRLRGCGDCGMLYHNLRSVHDVRHLLV